MTNDFRKPDFHLQMRHEMGPLGPNLRLIKRHPMKVVSKSKFEASQTSRLGSSLALGNHFDFSGEKMKMRVRHAIALLAMAASGYLLIPIPSGRTSLIVAANAAPQGAPKPAVGDPVSASAFAWSLFVQAMTPNNGALTFESWKEQTCIIQPSSCQKPSAAQTAAAGRLHHLHRSPLRQKIVGARTKATQAGANCGVGEPMNSPSPQTTPVFQGFFPKNLSSNPCFFEEVFVNPAEYTFITQNGLATLTGQQAYGNQHGGAITFPWDAVEIKVDWVPTASFNNPTFKCPDTTHQLYTETIGGTCYALVGIHFESKVLPDWLWATFEPNSTITNPNRCNQALYTPCFDPFGTTSRQPYGPGQPATQSPTLQQMMQAAKLDPAFNNYFLTGVSTQFVDGQGTPMSLGNSFTEFNAQVAPGQASCITCHRYAYFDGQKPARPVENNFGGPLGSPNFPNWPAIGFACYGNPNANCMPPANTTGWTSQDFSWMLGLMPYK
jgi:hypothetical protein